MRSRACYLLLSFFSGFLELGAVLFSIRKGWSPPLIFIVALGYQAGAAILNARLPLKADHFRTAIGAALVLTLVLPTTALVLTLTLVLLSAGLQGLRAEAIRHQRVGTAAKRSSRIGGFFAAGLFAPSTLLAVIGLSLIAGVLLRRADGDVEALPPEPSPRRSVGPGSMAMVIHQMHYFSYAYALPILFVRTHGLEDFLASLTFCLGWVTYTSTPFLLRRLPVLPVVIAGHVGVAGLLFSLSLGSHGMAWLTCAWALTGFGGGTVFGIRRLAAEWEPSAGAGDMDMWENLGHVLGVAVAVGLASIGLGTGWLFGVAGCFALATVASLAIGAMRWNRSGHTPQTLMSKRERQ